MMHRMLYTPPMGFSLHFYYVQRIECRIKVMENVVPLIRGKYTPSCVSFEQLLRSTEKNITLHKQPPSLVLASPITVPLIRGDLVFLIGYLLQPRYLCDVSLSCSTNPFPITSGDSLLAESTRLFATYICVPSQDTC